MAIEKIIKIMKNHGLYCVALDDRTIGLTDNAGKVYNKVAVTDDGRIIDGNMTMSLVAWLGY